MKLSYIVDLVSISKGRKQISGFTYRRYKYGPFDDKIYQYLTELRIDKVIHEDVSYTPMGDGFIIYNFNEAQDYSFDRLSKEDRITIDEVLETVKGYGAKSLVELSYNTKPMKKIGAKIGNDKGLNQILNLSAR
jgi:uncharacterized phage-associated protein